MDFGRSIQANLLNGSVCANGNLEFPKPIRVKRQMSEYVVTRQ